jgi:two-component sensor histidine kinase/CheY-like chemotaxis protein
VTSEESGPRLLYIDDDEGFARLLSRALGRMGFKVTHAPDGASGLAMVAEQSFDVIALDHYMPGLSGEETLERIIEMPSPPPVVYVTASDETQVAVSALKAGASDYVIKDMGTGFFDLLAAILQQAIEGYRLRRVEQAAQAEVALARERAEILLVEVNHRVANSLTLVVSMAHLQAGAMPHGEARDAIEDFANRVYAIAQVHKRLYTSQDIRSVALDGYLAELVRDLHRSISSQKAITRITFDCPPIAVSVDRAISIGVILSEFITNVSKYAYPGDLRGEVRVRVVCADITEARLEVDDDGVGISSETPQGTGLGTQVMEALASGLNGRISFARLDRGTRAILHFEAECPGS